MPTGLEVPESCTSSDGCVDFPEIYSPLSYTCLGRSCGMGFDSPSATVDHDFTAGITDSNGDHRRWVWDIMGEAIWEKPDGLWQGEVDVYDCVEQEDRKV